MSANHLLRAATFVAFRTAQFKLHPDYKIWLPRKRHQVVVLCQFLVGQLDIDRRRRLRSSSINQINSGSTLYLSAPKFRRNGVRKYSFKEVVATASVRPILLLAVCPSVFLD